MTGITTHILDTSLGQPAAGIAVLLEKANGAGWDKVGDGTTNADGRAQLLDQLAAPGTYRLTFEVAPYFASSGTPSFYPVVHITFTVDAERHYHVPLLLSAYGFSTYRGS